MERWVCPQCGFRDERLTSAEEESTNLATLEKSPPPSPSSGETTPPSNESNSVDGGEVLEVTTRGYSVIEKPFPAFAKARLGDLPYDQRRAWLVAWESVDSVAREWDPAMNLTKYFARCRELRRQPQPDEWVRWFTEEELKARREAKAEEAKREAEDETNERRWYD